MKAPMCENLNYAMYFVRFSVKMFLRLMCYSLVANFLTNGFLIEDLEGTFGEKDCIEASLVSFSMQEDAGIMIESSTTNRVLENISVKYDKTATSKIHELAQHNDIEFFYRLISEEGPPHNRLFTVSLTLADEVYEGSGPSLKKAKQEAAALALASTSYEQPPEKIKEEQVLTPTVALNNVAMKLGLGVTYHLLNGREEHAIDTYGAFDEAYGKPKSFFPKLNDTFSSFRIPTEEAQISGPFTVKVQIGDLAFKGSGHSIQAARHDAAHTALRALEKQALLRNNVCTNEETYDECKKAKEALKSPISRVYEFAQQQKLTVDFEIVSETGKSHKKIFVTQCKLGQFVTEGEGSSKKESKRIAAERMLENLPHFQNIYDENAIVSGLSDKKKKKKKKKKNKILRSSNDNSFIESVSDIVSSVWSSSYNPDSKETLQNKKSPKKSSSAKDKLLEIGNNLNIPIDFTDLVQLDGNFHSIVSLGVHPPHICLGKAANREKSHEFAAFRGIKFLQKLGLLEKTSFSKDGLTIDEIVEEEEEEGTNLLLGRLDKEEQ